MPEKSVSNDNSLRALVTGASSGIGLALAEVLARNGHDLILVARRGDRLKEIARELAGTHGIDVRTIAFDLEKSGAAEQLFQQVSESGFSIDILVNNAGRGHVGSFTKQDVSQMRGTLELNMVSLTVLTRLFAEQMQKRGAGKILNVASVAAFVPGPGFAVYHATKAFVLSLTEALNAELKGAGVSVTASCPGPTESEFHGFSGTDTLDNFTLMKFMTAEKVAEEAYDGMMQGRGVVVHGWLNNLLTITPKAMPRSWVPGVVQRFMK